MGPAGDVDPGVVAQLDLAAEGGRGPGRAPSRTGGAEAPHHDARRRFDHAGHAPLQPAGPPELGPPTVPDHAFQPEPEPAGQVKNHLTCYDCGVQGCWDLCGWCGRMLCDYCTSDHYWFHTNQGDPRPDEEGTLGEAGGEGAVPRGSGFAGAEPGAAGHGRQT